MAKWKLCRQFFGAEEFTFQEGDQISIGRGFDNTITLSSIVVSRNHCVIKVLNDKVLITDLKSSNGTYVGLKKIPVNTPFTIQEFDVIGFGWTKGATVSEISDNDKHVFKLIKENPEGTISSRILYQDSEDELELKIASLECEKKPLLTEHKLKHSLKRKSLDIIEAGCVKQKKDSKKENITVIKKNDIDVINLLSDSESDATKKELQQKVQPKIDPILEESAKLFIKKEIIKTENDLSEYEAFEVKQEYLGYFDDEPIQIDSDTDSESEHWLLRLSQSSPGKPFTKIAPKRNTISSQDNSSYSQVEEPIVELDTNEVDEEEYDDDIISIPPYPHITDLNNCMEHNTDQKDLKRNNKNEINKKKLVNELIVTDKTINDKSLDSVDKDIDSVDGCTLTPAILIVENQPDIGRKALMIEPLVKLPRRSNYVKNTDKRPKNSSKQSKSSKHSSSKSHSHKSDLQKEERKKKLKQIATKDKEETEQILNINSVQSNKTKVNVKVTSSNRGAFLTDVVQAVVKPMSRKDSPEKSSKVKRKKSESSHTLRHRDDSTSSKIKKPEKPKKQKDKSTPNIENLSVSKSKKSPLVSETRIPLKCVKPLTESEETGKPTSKVDPLPFNKKKKKSVRFSDAPPEIRLFEIDPGNRMNKTSLVKTALVDGRRMTKLFSLQKITLIKILHWNPHWLDEQISNNDPPPILGHNNPPMAIFQAFESHRQYVGQVGDLLLMEIWECITQGYMRVRQLNNWIHMKVKSLPLVPTQDRDSDLSTILVEVSLPKSELRNVPRMGEIMLVNFGPESAITSRFLFVANVQPPNNKHTCFTITLQTRSTEKMRSLRLGDIMVGKSLAYINNELTLFDAMEYLAGSPLSDAILRPEPHHFPVTSPMALNIHSEWTRDLNESQQMAVSSSVAAALGDRPSIQMVQGPPGTGKSSVICSIVMAYFYDAAGRRQNNRGKILICATSNAAVDELVIRLLNIRQNLPRNERFRMVRVGRAEAMHARAREVSSQQLAQRDLARAAAEPPATATATTTTTTAAAAAAAAAEEISRLTARINMWETARRDAKDPARVAYCEDRIKQLAARKTLIGNGGARGGGEEPRPEDVSRAERRIIDLADIVLTTLASAVNQKMRGLKRRIALCIVDEAGQAIEPETLIPLTLDVTKLTLIGDPQQLPGYICSQRAKHHGLGESLFSRLASRTEQWPQGGPVVLLNRQYRMHPDIADYPNRAFYDGRIYSSDRPRPPLTIPPYSIVSIFSGDKGQSTSGANEMEAWGVARLVASLHAVTRRLQLSLAVITPYNAHKDLIKKFLRTMQQPQDTALEVNTVDSFQGQERDVVVVSLARSHGVGFLTDAGRMNVMLTRAKHALLICLNPPALLKNHQWRTLVEDAQRRKLMRELPRRICHPVTPGQPVEDVLKFIV